MEMSTNIVTGTSAEKLLWPRRTQKHTKESNADQTFKTENLRAMTKQFPGLI